MKYILFFLLLSPCCIKAQTFKVNSSLGCKCPELASRILVLVNVNAKVRLYVTDKNWPLQGDEVRYNGRQWIWHYKRLHLYGEPIWLTGGGETIVPTKITTKWIPESASYSQIEPGNEQDDHPFRGFGDLFFDFYGLSQAYDRTHPKVTDTLPITSRSSNPSGTVYLTTTDPRITLEYIGAETINSPLVVHKKIHLWPFHRKKKQLILCGTFTHMTPIKQ